jgi:Leucine-rich repeat (LRR) protein
VLDLSENAIHNIDNQTFQGLVSLIKLDLSSNMLNEIRTEFSSSGDLRLLIILNLSMNKIEHVDENAFASLSSLGKLILYGNHVQIEKSSKFYDKLINLEELDDDDDEEYLHYESVNQFRDN